MDEVRKGTRLCSLPDISIPSVPAAPALPVRARLLLKVTTSSSSSSCSGSAAGMFFVVNLINSVCSCVLSVIKHCVSALYCEIFLALGTSTSVNYQNYNEHCVTDALHRAELFLKARSFLCEDRGPSLPWPMGCSTFVLCPVGNSSSSSSSAVWLTLLRPVRVTAARPDAHAHRAGHATTR